MGGAQLANQHTKPHSANAAVMRHDASAVHQAVRMRQRPRRTTACSKQTMLNMMAASRKVGSMEASAHHTGVSG